MATPVRTSTRLAVAAGAVGLVGGLALGASGLAAAVSPSPAPDHRAAEPGMRPHGLPARGQRGGLVSAISPSALTLRTPNGPKTVTLTDSTVFYDGKDKATRSVVSVGDVVRVRLVDPRGDQPVAATVVVLPAHLAGWVTAKEGDVLTITDHDGFTRTIRTSTTTTVMKEGKTASLSAVTVGRFVRALGHVAPDGTTLNAERIVLGGSLRRPGGGPTGDEQVSPET